MTASTSINYEPHLINEAKPALTVDEFCFAHGNISRAFFYKLVKQGQGPRLLKLGSRTLITSEAAAEWRREMENRTAEEDAHDA